MAAKRKKTAGLYWVTTPDHDEDWFIIAKNRRSATSYHEDYEGYDPGEAMARQVVLGIVLNEGDSVPRHAQLPDLRALGFEVVQTQPSRVVRLGRRTFREGRLQEVVNALYGAMALKRLRDENSAKPSDSKAKGVD